MRVAAPNAEPSSPGSLRDRGIEQSRLCVTALAAAVLFLGGGVSPASAQQAVNSATGVALFPGGSVVRSRIETRTKSRIDGTDIDVLRVPTTLSYGLTPDVTVGVAIPYFRKDITSRDASGVVSTATPSGLGDTFLTVKYRYFVRNYRGGSTQLAALGGVKLPTGDTEARDSTGALLPIPDQLGTGSVDFIGALTATRVFGYKWALHGSLLYKRNTEGDRDFRAGDFVNYNVAASREVYFEPYPGPNVFLGLELNGEYSARNKLNGTTLRNSGGNRILLSPTIVAFLTRNWTLEASVQFPMVENLNGNQPDEDPRFVLGFRFQYATQTAKR